MVISNHRIWNDPWLGFDRLFSIYINDLPNCLLQSKILLYADDAVLFNADSNIGNISTVLNKDLIKTVADLDLYVNKLCIHSVKTECVLFSTQQLIASATLSDGPFLAYSSRTSR